MTATNDLRSQHDELHEELAAGFAVGALDSGDLDRFRSLLQSCDACARLAAEYRSIAALLPVGLEPMDASPSLRQRVLDGARRTAPRTTGVSIVTPDPSSRPAVRPIDEARGRTAQPQRRFLWALPLAALVTVVLGMGYWNYQLHQRVAEQAALIQSQHEMLTAVAAGGRQWSLAGTQAAPTASGVVVEDPRSQRPVLLVVGLPTLPPERAYQAWVIAGGVPHGAGLLESDGRGGQIARLNQPLTASIDTVAVTIEPALGSPAPTGPIMVAGNL